MTKDKAILLALKIVNICKKYEEENRCLYCPFNIGGCVFNGEVPTEWRVAELPRIIEKYRKDKTE